MVLYFDFYIQRFWLLMSIFSARYHKSQEQINSEQSQILAAQNRGPLQLFRLKAAVSAVPALPGETSATIFYRDGHTRKEELYYGSGYLSQSGRFVIINEKVGKIEFADGGGKTRIFAF